MVRHYTEGPYNNAIFPCHTGVQGKKTDTILNGIENHSSALSSTEYMVCVSRAVDSIRLTLHINKKFYIV
jgi:hypothetical protein